MSEIDGEASTVFVDQPLNQFPSCNESSHEYRESSVMLPSQQRIVKLSGKESGQDVTRENKPLLPVILVPKTERLDDIEREEPMDDNSVPGNDMYEIDEETEPTNPQHWSSK
ncbi:hypothetical protein R5R35_004221 [Gryllus longicercus]|uniref:Uncharacterized protein n=1 Tax=Gryllus longicercus TaxID=2509291 RepID=A0AAN9WPF0_9ORTH